ncbi:flagellar protein FlaG protein [Halomonas citrativorans]|uniref:Flagellar protein FlaG protein n=1 Tax=Halomonas citrativorans TaxID=2742612 RepID=A0A1R4I1Q4_9GAMM|nr:flagellar protein FlaG [Halomonas citrativorans]SJN13676.1 flagellar protein FlaG protein [Halomonas citrativorans]
MTSPLTDTITTLSATPTPRLTPQQRLDSTLAQLSMTDNSGAQTGSGAASGTTAVTKGELIEPIQRINAAMQAHGIEFDVSDESSRIVTRVIDRESGDVIRQIPSEEVLAIAERLEEMQGRLISLEV